MNGWNYIKNKLPDNQEEGTLFEIHLLQVDSRKLAKHYYRIIKDSSDNKILREIGTYVEMPLISNWIEEFGINDCLKDRWRYITENKMMAFL